MRLKAMCNENQSFCVIQRMTPKHLTLAQVYIAVDHLLMF
jgi:hypothetical protein